METRDYLANRLPVPTGTLLELFFEAVEGFTDKVALRTILPDGGLQGITYREVLSRVGEVAGGLRSMGLSRGDRVALLSENRPEWAFVDYGALCAGTPLVPIHTTLVPAQVAFILENSGSRALFVSGGPMLEKARQALEGSPGGVRLVVFDSGPELPPGSLGWEAFLEGGRRVSAGGTGAAFREAALSAGPQDTATILYTSGTTGEPKGVVLTHNNLASNARAAALVVPVDDTDETLSFLPLSHSLQRLVDYVFFWKGSTITYGRSMQTIGEDLRIVHPTKVVAAPRFFEKTFQKVMEQRGVASLIVRWAREVGEAWAEEKLAGRKPTWILEAVHGLAHALVFRRIHEGLGGRIVFFLSGGAPLAPEINKFFFSAGILVLEGYGLSETSPCITVSGPGDFQIGAVGPPLPGTEIRIAKDGEILVRGPQVMKEYFNRPEDTAEAMDSEGWFRTGDIGEIDLQGHLRITDRKKNIIVTAGGKNIAPAPIENRVMGNRFVEQVVMIGDQRNFPSLLVVPDFATLGAWCREVGVRATTRREILQDQRVQEHLRKEIFGSIGELSSFEKPKKIGLIQEEFTIEGGILTPNLKVRRRVVHERFGALIHQFYDPANVGRDLFVEEGP